MSHLKSQIRVADLPPSIPVEFDLRPEPEQNQVIAQELGLSGLRKLWFRGTLNPEGKRDWRLDGLLGATVTQPCVATLAPVITRIDEPVTRQYLAQAPQVSDDEEVEMPDDSVEELPAVIDLEQVMIEALALALPLYPRADDAAIAKISVTEPGKAPMTDQDTKPFAGLAQLRDKLNNED